MALRPILARTSSINGSVKIRNNCGTDNICTPDLRLTSTLDVVEYLLGSDKRIELNVTVENTNENAFEATYYLMLPRGVDYIKIERIDKSEIPVQCLPPKAPNNNTLKCNIGNPLPNGNFVKFTVFLQPVSVHDEERSSYEFMMVVNSSDSEDLSTIRDNTQIISMKIRVDTDLLIEGESKPTDIFYDHDNYTTINITSELEYGLTFTHNYTIHNRGPSRIEAADIFLIWPARTLANDEFLHLIEKPETSANVVYDDDDDDVRAGKPIGGEQFDVKHPLCKSSRCVQLRCDVGRLEKDEEVWISARYGVNAAFLKKVALYENLKVSTLLISNVTKLPNVGEPTRVIIKSYEISTNLQPKASAPAPDVAPLWIVLLSACAGVIILLLLTFLLHKVRFNRINLFILKKTVGSINLKLYKFLF